MLIFVKFFAKMFAEKEKVVIFAARFDGSGSSLTIRPEVAEMN